jgi:hypothetical protein
MQRLLSVVAAKRRQMFKLIVVLITASLRISNLRTIINMAPVVNTIIAVLSLVSSEIGSGRG